MRAQFDRAQAKVELDKASKISNIRHNIEAVLLKILDVNSKQSKRVEVVEKNMNKNTREKAKRELELRWASEVSPLQEQLTQLEQTLSELENREPRNFDLLSINRLQVFRTANTAHLGREIDQEQWWRVGPSEKYVAR